MTAKCSSMPSYVILSLLGFWGCFNMYALRLNLSVAIVDMSPDVDNETIEWCTWHFGNETHPRHPPPPPPPHHEGEPPPPPPPNRPGDPPPPPPPGGPPPPPPGGPPPPPPGGPPPPPPPGGPPPPPPPPPHHPGGPPPPPPPHHHGPPSPNSCKKSEFAWDSYTKGIILGCYFYGHAISHLPGGRMSELISAKWLYGFGILGSSILSILSPVAVRYSQYAFIAVRVLQGVLSGIVWPVLHIMLARWVPLEKRSLVSALVYTGRLVGTAAAMQLTGVMIQNEVMGGWPSAFYIFGIIGCVWFFFWIFLVYDFPEKHPRISRQELESIQSQHALEHEKDKLSSSNIPWRQILCSAPVWALCCSHFGNSYGLETLTLELPTYMDRFLHYKIEENGIISSLPFILDALTGAGAAFVSDLAVLRGWCTITTIRKICAGVAYMGAALCYGVVTFCNHSAALSLTMFMLCLGFSGIAAPSVFVVQMDMSPEYAGSLMGFSSFFGSVAGFVAPYIIGVLTQDSGDIGSWRVAFFIIVGVYIATTIVFCVWGSAEKQNWGVETNPVVETQQQTTGVQLTNINICCAADTLSSEDNSSTDRSLCYSDKQLSVDRNSDNTSNRHDDNSPGNGQAVTHLRNRGDSQNSLQFNNVNKAGEFGSNYAKVSPKSPGKTDKEISLPSAPSVEEIYSISQNIGFSPTSSKYNRNSFSERL